MSKCCPAPIFSFRPIVSSIERVRRQAAAGGRLGADVSAISRRCVVVQADLTA